MGRDLRERLPTLAYEVRGRGGGVIRQDDFSQSAQRVYDHPLATPATTKSNGINSQAEVQGANGRKKDGHYEGRTRDLGVSRMKAISTTL